MFVIRRRVALALGVLGALHACGRSELAATRVANVAGASGLSGEGGEAGAAGAPGESCESDLDCELAEPCAESLCLAGRCAPPSPIVCDDADPCTTDSCDRLTGACRHVPPIDADGDGFVAAGESGLCGTDCDDEDSGTHPGAAEVCDGEDNDCDLDVDEDTAIGFAGFEPVRVSTADVARASRGGLALGGGALGLTYTGLRDSRWRSYFATLDPSGNVLSSPALVSEINADTYAGLVVWSGQAHGTAWADARQDGNYEVYFSRFSESGEKLSPDIRLSNAPEFSLHPALIAVGDAFVVAWDDRRGEDSGVPAQIFGRFVDASGALGLELPLTNPAELAEYPALALGKTSIGLVYTVLEGGSIRARVRWFDHLLQERIESPPVTLEGIDVQEPAITAVGDVFVITWQTYDLAPGDAIYAAVVDEHGNVVHQARAVTSGASFARSHSVVSLGEHFVLVWADDFAGNYELFAQTFSVDLEVMRPRERLTFDGAESLFPVATLNPGGGLGILFDDWRSGSRQVYYTRLECLP